ncbi:hypothetical protein FisN_4Lh058 [Fistulifera solaris]|uniref:Uncharacterized protein n=1 Tax=Fistulifera solaris TaxID=1519565 RepID=A0A1Z5KDQ6_FISSO|nr:hypothetical protein FisN_4Lh058 [Fistulifera solaris]|eukprot:GAX24241.1 hypothetical protein FisN_4Lh058 [Fistulifera solaris]
MTMTTVVKEKRKRKCFLLQKVRILTISIPIVYSVWLAISNAWALNHRETDRNEIIATVFARVSFAPNDSPRHGKSIPNDGAAAATPNKRCLQFNSHAWLRGPRLGNANHSFGMDDSLGKYLIISAVHWSNDNLPILLQKSICEQNSIFVQRQPTKDAESELRHWVVRLVYMYVHYHQHRHAFTEAQNMDSQCILERQEAGIGPFDFECASAKFLVVRFYNNGIGANMRYAAVPALMAGLATDRVVLFINNSPVGPPFLQQPWSQVTCDRRDAQCFFLPSSPCALTHYEIEEAYSLQKIERRHLFRTGTLPKDRQDDRVLLLQLPFRAQRIPQNLRGKVHTTILPLIRSMTNDPDLQQTLFKAADQLQKDDNIPQNESFSYYGMDSPLFHGLLLYALRPNPRALHRIDDIVKSVLPPSFESRKSIGLPIRASDKCDIEMECMSFANHLDAAQESWQAFDHAQSQQPFTIVTTESQKIKDEMNLLKRTNATDFVSALVVNHLDVTQNTGYFKPSPIENTYDKGTDEAILSAMASLRLQLYPRFTLGNCCSSFHLMLKDILSEGCGAYHDHVFQCLQTHANPQFRTCCSWDKSADCIARRENASIIERA